VRIDPSDRGFTLGDGLFETMCVVGGRVLRQGAHMARLSRGAQIIGVTMQPVDWNGAFTAVLGANGLKDTVLRLTVTRGVTSRGLVPPENARSTIIIVPSPIPPPMPPAHCIIATVTRRNEHSPICGIKSLNFLDSILARQEAVSRGADDAILLNTRGNVAESTAANIFAVKNGDIVTPPQADGILAGTMREAVLAETRGQERPLTCDELFDADELFLTNSLGIRAIASLNGRQIGSGNRQLSLRLAARLLSSEASGDREKEH
jgi:branched-chain amino acid aminotransferase